MSALVVDAQARVTQVDQDAAPDVLWALRGGGPSFGVVLSYTVRLHSIPPLVTSFAVNWPVSQSAQVINTFMQWVSSSSRDMSPSLFVSAGRVTLSGTFLSADVRRLSDALATMLFVGTPTVTNHTSPFAQAASLPAERFQDVGNDAWKAKSLFANVTSIISTPAIVDSILSALVARTARSYIIFDSYTGAVADVARPDATAFPHRNPDLVLMQFVAVWPDFLNPDAQAEALSWSRSLAARLESLLPPPHYHYVNYPDADLGDQSQGVSAAYLAGYWAGNSRRLLQVKRQVDPDNVFQYAQSIPVPS